MARFEIQADFDHDGKISQSATEAKLKLTPPGLILIPNLDADGRARPRPDEIGKPARLDFELVGRRARDRELNPFIVHPTPAADAQGRLFIEILGRLCFRPKLYDADRRLIRSATTTAGVTTHVFAIPVDPARDRQFYIETDHLPGDPFCQVRRRNASPLARLRTTPFGGLSRFHEKLLDWDFILLRLVSLRSGVTTIEDTAVLSHAPMIFVDNTAAADRIYVAEIPDRGNVGGNSPTLSELRTAARAFPRVPLAIVPDKVNQGDAWLQDQFQSGYCHRPGSPPLPMVFHMPRARENVVTIGKGNLSAFVAYHFPASDQALYQRFWERTFGKAEDETGREHEISFADSFELFLEIDAVWGAYSVAVHILRELKPTASITRTLLEIERIWTIETLSQARFKLERVGRKVTEHVAKSPATRVQSTVDTLAKLLEQRIDRIVRGGIKVVRPARDGGDKRLEFKLSGSRHRRFEQEAIDRLAAVLPNVHHSINFGGNLEVAPPTTSAELGTIIFGTQLREDQPGDRELVRFLIAQKVQPFVHINTNWLSVGHIDEVMCFLPAAANGGSFAIALASPQIAINILNAALFFAREGRPSEAPVEEHEFGIQFPARGAEEPDRGIILTRALRGKYWLHQESQTASIEHVPPELYREMALTYELEIDYRSSNDERHYDASISVLELLHFARRSNAAIHEHQINKRIRAQLSNAFPSAVIAELPVYFNPAPDLEQDRVKAADFENVHTEAFLPNLVNMQVVDNHVIVPKPFGPRMTPKNAATILRQVLPAEYRGKANEAALRARGLHINQQWVFAPIPSLNPFLTSGAPGRRTDLERLATVFGDGFHESVAFGERHRVIVPLTEQKEAWRKANAGLFGPGEALKKGWNRVVVPGDETIDLFQAYADIVLSALGITVHWVDSWYYHIRSGELHCGTNVIRRPNVKRPWWVREGRD